MPFVFLAVGILFILVVVRGTTTQAVALLKSEFSGQNSFLEWAMAVFIIGGLGYIKAIRPIADAFLLLLLFVIFVKSDSGFFAKFNQQVQQGFANPQPAAQGSVAATLTQPASQSTNQPAATTLNTGPAAPSAPIAPNAPTTITNDLFDTI